MIARFREFVELIERLNVAFGGTDGEVLFKGEHFELSHNPDTIRALPTPEKKTKRKQKGQQKTGWKVGSGKRVMNQAEDPQCWPFESRDGVPSVHKRSKEVQKILKNLLSGSSPVSRTEVFKHVRKRLPVKLRNEKDTLDRIAWEMTLGALLRNYSKAGYLTRVVDRDPSKETFSLPGKVG